MAKKKELPSPFKPFKEAIEMKPLALLKYLKENQKALREVYSVDEMNAIHCRILDYMYEEGESLEGIEEDSENNRRQIWYTNHVLIMRTIHTYIKQYGTLPSVTHISEETSLSRVTITKHLKYFEKDEFLNFHRQKWKLATENLMKQVYSTAFTDFDTPNRLKAAALFLKYADKILYPGNSRKEAGQTNNFIQINNIFINQETIKALPEDKRQTIETLILEANERKG